MRELRKAYGPDYEQPTAVPMLTEGYNLPAGHVIHIVGPIVSGPLTAGHERALAACYKNVLNLCAENALKTVAFCCISTGVFRFPNQRAAEIAVSTVKQFPRKNLKTIVFNVFLDKDYAIYRALL